MGVWCCGCGSLWAPRLGHDFSSLKRVTRWRMAIATSTSVFCVLHRCCHVLVLFLFVFWLRGLFILSRLQARTLFASMPTVGKRSLRESGSDGFRAQYWWAVGLEWSRPSGTWTHGAGDRVSCRFVSLFLTGTRGQQHVFEAGPPICVKRKHGQTGLNGFKRVVPVRPVAV